MLPLVSSGGAQLKHTLAYDLTATFLSKSPRSALDKISPRAVSYEEQSAAVREQLATVYEAQEEWSRAARALAGIDLDSGVRTVDPAYKLAKCVKIAMLYLEDDDAVAAESYIKKASSLLAACKDEEVELQYKTCYARVLDAKRRFLEAATRYYELSQTGQRVIGGRMVQEEDLAQALGAAVTCAVLAAAGPQRSRLLATLYKDERTARLPVFPFLEKVFMERVLRRDEVAAFAETLAPHQTALLPDGATVLERAVMEHNLEAASKLYRNVYVEELAQLLGEPVEKAEAAAARMVLEKRLAGSIDQVDGLLVFGAAEGPLEQWDRNIEGLCRAADAAVEAAAARGLQQGGA